MFIFGVGDIVAMIGEDLPNKGRFVDEAEAVDAFRVAVQIGIRERPERHPAEQIGEISADGGLDAACRRSFFA